MAAAAATRYSIASVRVMRETLEARIEQSQGVLDREEGRDYPSEDRIDDLTTRIEALQGALDALEEIEG